MLCSRIRDGILPYVRKFSSLYLQFQVGRKGLCNQFGENTRVETNEFFEVKGEHIER